MKREYKLRSARTQIEANAIIDEEIENGYEPISVGASESSLTSSTIYILFKLKLQSKNNKMR